MVLAGCQTPGIDASSLSKKDDAQLQQMTSTDEIHGPMERFAIATGIKDGEKNKKRQLVNPPDAMAAYHRGEELFKEKRYVEAEQVFWKDTAEKFAVYPIREDALFMTGECTVPTTALSEGPGQIRPVHQGVLGDAAFG